MTTTNNKMFLFFFLFSLTFVAQADAQQRHSIPHPDKLVYKPLQFNPPQAQRHAFKNGLIVYILEDHELPLVNISAVFRAGSVFDPPEKAGLSEITHRLMRTGGAGSLSGNELDDNLAFHGIALNISADMDVGSAHMSVLRQNVEVGMNLFSQILKNPRFETEKFELAKALYIEGLRSLRDNPSGYAFREFRKLLYRDNPRGRLYTASSIKNIQRSDLLDFHGKFFHPGSSMIVITGQLKSAEMLHLAIKYLSDWQPQEPPMSVLPPVGTGMGTIHYLHKDIPQSVIVSGHLAPSKQDPDYFAFTVLDFILGSGGFRSHIFQEIRNDRGLAYSTGSFYRARYDYGTFGAYAVTRSSATTTVLQLIRHIIDNIKLIGTTDDELSWAKRSLLNNYIFSFQDAKQIAFQQMMLEYEGLPRDFLLTYPARIEQITVDDLRRVADRYLKTKEALTLVLGNEQAFDAPLSTLGDVIHLQEEE